LAAGTGVGGNLPGKPASTIIWQPTVYLSRANGDQAPAMHPTDPLRAVLGGLLPIRYTTDGGTSWLNAIAPVGLGAGVPAWLPGGDGLTALHVSLGSTVPPGSALQFSKSGDGGAHWGAPSTLAFPNVSEDLPYLWADTNPASPRYGRVYLTVNLLDAAGPGSFDTVRL